MILFTIGLVILLIVLLYVFLVWNYDYWKKRGVEGPKPKLIVGNSPNMFSLKRHIVCDLQDIYEAYKNTHNYVGIFSGRFPQLFITDAQLVHRIFVNDFKYFHDNEMTKMVDEKSDYILANNPFLLTGEEWKTRRAELTPGLTTSRIKAVFPVTRKICKVMVDFIRQQIKIGSKDGMDGKDLCLRFTSEVVTDCVLGLSAAGFSDKPTPVLHMIYKLFQQSPSWFIFAALRNFLPCLRSFYKGRFTPKSVEEFFIDLMQKAIETRKTQNKENSQVERLDFLNYMLELQEKKNYSTKELTAHTMTFLVDGFETTASVLSHCLLFLGRHPEVQQKLRAEIEEKLGKSDEYESIIELPYLDACVHETIRIFPPGLFSAKICTEPIQLTNKDGRTFLVPEGLTVVLPLYPIMVDEEIYPQPFEFQPERFLEEEGGSGLKKYREMGVYLGFGDGPRICLGMRFALTQIKAALVEIVRHFNVRVNPKTRRDYMVDPTYIVGRLEGGIWLDFEERS